VTNLEAVGVVAVEHPDMDVSRGKVTVSVATMTVSAGK
jgi:hypothetical protein